MDVWGKHFAFKLANILGVMKRWNCSASWPCLACQVVFERKGFAREMVSNCNVGATTYTVCWVDTDQGAAPAFVDRRRSPGLGVFSGEGGSKRITTYIYPVQVPVLRYSSACKTMFRCRILAIVDVRYTDTMPRMPRLSSGV